MKEIRTQQTAQNTDNESRKVEGYAVVFNSLSSDLGGFFEIIEDGAIDEEVINRSDILCLLDHNKERGVLARATNGKGSLKLTLDSHGLKYEFEAPHTTLGDEILEGLRRGDISKCSFAFTVEKDRWEKKEDGTIIRHIDKIKQLYDVSLVYNPAYEDTEVKADTRGLKELQEKENNKNTDNSMEDKAKVIEQLKALISQLSDGDNKPTEDDVKDTASCDDKEQKANEDNTEDVKDDKENTDGGDTSDNSDDTNSEDNQTEEQPTDNNTEDNTDNSEQPKDDDPMDDADEDKEKRNNNKSSNINIRMSKKFSLIKAINDVVNNRSFDETTEAVIKEGRSAMVKAGLKSDDKIILPLGEIRAADNDAEGNPNGVFATLQGGGFENVATEKYDILEPLRANLIMSQAGATIINGCVGNISIPRYSGSNVAWKGEAVKADKGNGKWDDITLSPKRLTAYIKVSNQMLLQDSNSVDEMLKRDLLSAVSEKLEQTVFGSAAGTTTQPAGLFAGVTAGTTNLKYSDVIDAEAELENNNVNDYVYIVSPSTKAVLRSTSKDSGSGKFIMENGEIEGRKVYVSSVVTPKGLLVADMKDLVCAFWGGVSLTIDPFTYADEDCIRIVVNMYVDVKTRRDESFVKKILK